jgi:hypothetical protein
MNPDPPITYRNYGNVTSEPRRTVDVVDVTTLLLRLLMRIAARTSSFEVQLPNISTGQLKGITLKNGRIYITIEVWTDGGQQYLSLKLDDKGLPVSHVSAIQFSGQNIETFFPQIVDYVAKFSNEELF